MLVGGCVSGVGRTEEDLSHRPEGWTGLSSPTGREEVSG